MRVIDLDSWPRRRHFELFRTYDAPHFSLCAPVDVGGLRSAAAERGVSFTIALIYVLTRVANDIPEFRSRIRGEQVVEHDVVHPSTTVLTHEDIFGFCSLRYDPEFARFAPPAAHAIASATDVLSLDDEPYRDDVLFMTAVPWVAFTGLSHAMRLQPDCIPRISWGRITGEQGRMLMPVSVQVHHALADGLHVGRYFQRLEVVLGDATRVLNGEP